MPDTADKTAAARAQVEAFLRRRAARRVFRRRRIRSTSRARPAIGAIRRFVLHYAHLAQAAGGVDAFLIGSELRGLTTLRDEDDAFPFVEELCTLAGDVRAILGPATKITYGADWSEYFGHHPLDGSGDVYFHLDPLWAHPDIDAVGIDNYMPLSDWRDADYAGGNPDGFAGPTTRPGCALRSPAARGSTGIIRPSRRGGCASARRSPTAPTASRGCSATRICGAGGRTRTTTASAAWRRERRPHGCRRASRSGSPRSAAPQSTRGRTSRMSFPTRNRRRARRPIFRAAGVRDLAQQRFLAAHHRYWNPEDDRFRGGGQSGFAGLWRAHGRSGAPLCLGLGRAAVSGLSARGDRWSDGGNWHYGHWLNGRLGNPDVGELINAILADHGLPAADVDGADGTVHGYVIDEPGSARAALEPVVELFGLRCCEKAEGLVFRGEARRRRRPSKSPRWSRTAAKPSSRRCARPTISCRRRRCSVFAIRWPNTRRSRCGKRGPARRAAGSMRSAFRASLEAGQGSGAGRRLAAARLERARARDLCGDAAE